MSTKNSTATDTYTQAEIRVLADRAFGKVVQAREAIHALRRKLPDRQHRNEFAFFSEEVLRVLGSNLLLCSCDKEVASLMRLRGYDERVCCSCSESEPVECEQPVCESEKDDTD